MYSRSMKAPIQTLSTRLLKGALSLLFAAGFAATSAQAQTEIQADSPLQADGGSGFGIAVDMFEDLAIVGSWFDNGLEGSAHIYRLNGTSWVWEAELAPATPLFFEVFGTSASITKNAFREWAFIGAVFGEDTPGIITG